MQQSAAFLLLLLHFFHDKGRKSLLRVDLQRKNIYGSTGSECTPSCSSDWCGCNSSSRESIQVIKGLPFWEQVSSSSQGHKERQTNTHTHQFSILISPHMHVFGVYEGAREPTQTQVYIYIIICILYYIILYHTQCFFYIAGYIFVIKALKPKLSPEWRTVTCDNPWNRRRPRPIVKTRLQIQSPLNEPASLF